MEGPNSRTCWLRGWGTTMCGVIGTPKSREQLVCILLLNKMNKCICLIDKNVLEFLLKCTCLPVCTWYWIKEMFVLWNLAEVMVMWRRLQNLFKNNYLLTNEILLLFDISGETLDSLGIGIIDIKGGKVVKIGKSKYYAPANKLLNNDQIIQVMLV